MEPVAAPAPDPVSDALRAFNVHSVIFCQSELHAPWGFTVDGSPIAKFHLVLEGACQLSLPAGEAFELGAGDLVVLAGGAEHSMRDRSDRGAIPLGELLAAHPLDDDLMLRIDGPGPLTRLLCGGFTLTTEADFQALLPPVFRLDATSHPRSSWLQPLLARLASQADAGHQGLQAIQAKVADVFLAEALRAWLIDTDQAGLFAAAGTDDPVAQAVELLHRRYPESWTLSSIAREVGVSRTSLVTRFKAATGDSPIRFLTRVRLGHAARLLATTRLGHHEIARRSGYTTEAALAKAFKRERGQTMGAHRATSRAVPELNVAITFDGPRSPAPSAASSSAAANPFSPVRSRTR